MRWFVIGRFTAYVAEGPVNNGASDCSIQIQEKVIRLQLTMSLKKSDCEGLLEAHDFRRTHTLDSEPNGSVPSVCLDSDRWCTAKPAREKINRKKLPQ